MEKMMQETEQDEPLHRERAAGVYIRTFDRTLRQEDTFQIEEEGHTINTKFECDDLLEKLAVVPHSHPSDVPPSPDDILPVLIGNRPYPPAAIAITPKRKIAVFRGQNASKLSVDDTKRVTAEWKQRLKIEYARQIQSLEVNPEQQFAVWRNVQERLLREYAKEYGFRVFECSREENIAREISYAMS